MSQYFELCFSLYYFAENNPIIITIDKSIMVVLELIMVIFAILQIILFFKLWGMTNNIRNIREMLQCYIKDNTLNKDGKVKKEDNIVPVRLHVDEYIGKWGKYVTEEEIESYTGCSERTQRCLTDCPWPFRGAYINEHK